MEDLRHMKIDILNNKLYDSDTDHDVQMYMTLMKMKILFFPNYMHLLSSRD